MSKNTFLKDLKSAKISIRLCIIIFISFFVLKFLPINKIVELFAVSSESTLSLTGFYQIFTYWVLAIGDLISLISLCITMVLAGYIVEKFLSQKDVLILMGGTIILGGFLFAYLNSYSIIMTGPTIISWGLAGSAILIVFRTWSDSTKAAKIIVGIFVIGAFFQFYDLMFGNLQAKAATYILCGIFAAIYTFYNMRHKANWSEITKSETISGGIQQL